MSVQFGVLTSHKLTGLVAEVTFYSTPLGLALRSLKADSWQKARSDANDNMTSWGIVNKDCCYLIYLNRNIFIGQLLEVLWACVSGKGAPFAKEMKWSEWTTSISWSIDYNWSNWKVFIIICEPNLPFKVMDINLRKTAVFKLYYWLLRFICPVAWI